jgi:tetratricopeptide (TPR) repeat protein
MLQELGYEIVDESEEVPGGGEPLGYADHGGQERLPSYDLEEMRAADVSSQYADERQVYIGHRGGQATNEYGDGALPSFPLDEPDAGVPFHQDQNYGQEAQGYDGTQHQGQDYDLHGHDYGHQQDYAAPATADVAVPRAVSQAPTSIGQVAGRELEDALDEADFFCSRGLYDDARAILLEQLGKYPNHPLLRERIAELSSSEEQRGSGARERPREEDRAFDIAASLDALESLDYDVQPAEGFANEDQQIDVEEVFAKFKEGVAAQISVDDSDSHYNLGIAYKEMMLIDDAIREFDLAARDPKRECVCRSMIGMIHIERGNLNEAIDAFLAGLNAPLKDPQQETVLCYEIGAAYEAKKMTKDALSYYQKAMRRDPNYRDVQERVRRLAKSEPKTPLRQAAVGADDEFDRAFDDLVSKA